MHDAPDPIATRAVAGCSDALGRVWERRRGWLASILYAHAPRGVDVDDLLQDVAVKTVRGIGGVADPGALDAWLRTTAIHVARDAGRGGQGARGRGAH